MGTPPIGISSLRGAIVEEEINTLLCRKLEKGLVLFHFPRGIFWYYDLDT